MIKAPLRSTSSYTSTHHYERLLSTTTLDDVQPIRTLEASPLETPVFTVPHVLDANTAGFKNAAVIFQRKTIPPQVLWWSEHQGAKIYTLN